MLAGPLIVTGIPGTPAPSRSLTCTPSVPWLVPKAPIGAATRLAMVIGGIGAATKPGARRGLDPHVVGLGGAAVAALGSAGRVADPLRLGVDRVRDVVDDDGARLLVVREIDRAEGAQALLVLLGERRGDSACLLATGAAVRGVEPLEDAEDDDHEHRGGDDRLHQCEARLGIPRGGGGPELHHSALSALVQGGLTETSVESLSRRRRPRMESRNEENTTCRPTMIERRRPPPRGAPRRARRTRGRSRW